MMRWKLGVTVVRVQRELRTAGTTVTPATLKEALTPKWRRLICRPRGSERFCMTAFGKVSTHSWTGQPEQATRNEQQETKTLASIATA